MTAEPMTAEPMTAVVVTRDRQAELLRCVARLRDLPEHPEVTVVDNGSADGSVAALRQRFGATAAPGAVRVVPLPANAGAVAREVGVWLARTPVVAFCDDDSWWEPGALARAARLLAAEPRLGLLAAKVVVEPAGTVDPTCVAMAASPLRSEVRGADGPLPAVLGFLACGAVVRRSAFVAAGGFDGLIGTGGEEESLALAMADLGWALAYDVGLVAHHQPSRVRQPSARRRQGVGNALRTAWRYRPPAAAARRTLTVLADGPWASSTLGAMDAARALPGVLAGRTPLRPPVEAAVRLVEEQQAQHGRRAQRNDRRRQAPWSAVRSDLRWQGCP